jgi:hypothetical protein
MLQFAATSYTVGQDAGSITIDVKRTGNPGSLVTVVYATGGGSAQAGTNYTATTGTLTFNPNELDKTFVIPIIDTHMVAANTFVNLTLSNPTGGATLGTPNPVTLTIRNNNQLTMQLGAAGFTVGELAGKATITVTRNSGSTSSTITYTTSGGSATPGLNYSPASGVLVFSPGQTSQSFTIPILHDSQVTGPLTVGIVLSSPTGGFLGDPSAAVLTLDDADLPGTLQLGTSATTVNPGAGVVKVIVNRVGGVGGTVTVNFATGGGSAVPGTDYTPVSGILTFNPGETTKTIAVPILNNPAAGNKAFGLTLSSPGGGATLGSPAAITVTISAGASRNNSNGSTPNVIPNATGPVITDLQLQNNGQAITGIVLSFNRPLDAARAQEVANYGYVIRTPGPDRAFGTFDDGTTPIASAVYDPATNRVTLTPASPLAMNTFYQIAINQNANALTGAGVADTSGTLLNAGIADGPYVAQFGLGTKLSYTDHNGDLVSLTLGGGGLMELRRGANGDAQQLRILNGVPGGTTLKGQVRRGGKGSDGRTSLPLILGAAGVKVQLKSFAVGSIVKVPSAQGQPPKKSHHRHRRH